MLNTHFHVVPTLRMRGALSPFPIRFNEVNRDNFHSFTRFYFLLSLFFFLFFIFSSHFFFLAFFLFIHSFSIRGLTVQNSCALSVPNVRTPCDCHLQTFLSRICRYTPAHSNPPKRMLGISMQQLTTILLMQQL
jgi:hypothetical protein